MDQIETRGDLLLADHPSRVVEGPELAVVIPCFNERLNVAPMVERLHAALRGLRWEAIFVDDDSPDGTTAAVREIAPHDPHIRCVRRIGRRGLASAVIEGALATSATYVAVIDGDLQHDETRLPVMLDLLRQDVCDIVVGSRHVEGGDASGLAGAGRHFLSDLGGRMAQIILPVRVTDPMSGFFMLRQDMVEHLAPRMSRMGFKILLDLLLSSPTPLRLREVGYQFRERTAGESKLNILVLAEFLGLIVDKMSRGLVPLRFIAFAMVGFCGVFIDLAVLAVAHSLGAGFGVAQIVATIITMGFNFQLNNEITYRDQRLKGRKLLRGLALFIVVCGIGNIANIGVAQVLFAGKSGWTVAGAVGAAIGVVWNYAVSSTLVWRRR